MNSTPTSPLLCAITGPTACGKTRVAVGLAKIFDAEIISADSRQIYQAMDLGTGKDLDEYEGVPYHLIDICPAGEKYNLHRYLRDYEDTIADMQQRGARGILCGGSGLYLESALSGVKMVDVPQNDELRASLSGKSLEELKQILEALKQRTGTVMHNVSDVDTARRAIRAIEIETYREAHPEEFADATLTGANLNVPLIGLEISREERRERISRRLKIRLEQGMLQEVQTLLDSGIPAEDLIYYGLEYKFLTLHLIGKLTYQEMFTGLETAIHQFAKRQMTWFRGMERRGLSVKWFPYDTPLDILAEYVSQTITNQTTANEK